MNEHILIGIVSVLALGIGSQWLAWRLRFPSILLLLVVGFLAGPVIGWLDPASLQGDWVFAFVSLAISIILFESSLSLRLEDLREVGKATLNLITVGVGTTWVLAGAAAYYLLDFNISLSILVGAILTVTGPTVIIPLLRHVRPSGRIGTVAKWEGIIIDPIGAILAVLVLEVIRLLHEPMGPGSGSNIGDVIFHTLEGLFLEVFTSVGVSIIATGILVLVLRRRTVPDYLQNAVVLMILVTAFAIANYLQDEAGLLTATLMGIFLANQKSVQVRHIMEFKENLSVMLIGSLFILLSARIELADLSYLGTGSFIFLGVLILLVRPVAVLLSARGTDLSSKEKVFLAWLAPRGVVAAATAGLFSFRLAELFPEQVGALVPTIFLVIVGTVSVYGLTMAPLARRLGLAQPDPQGVLVVGAHRWARALASALQAHGFRVLLIDTNVHNVAEAEQSGLEADHADALSEAAIDRLDLSGIGRMIAVTANDVVNSLVALHFVEVFGRDEVYQLAAHPESRTMRSGELPMHLRGRPLFGEEVTYTSLNKRFRKGGRIQSFDMTESLNFEQLREKHGKHITPLFVIGSDQKLTVVSERDRFSTKPGDTLLALVGRVEEHNGRPEDEAPAEVEGRRRA